MIKKVAILGLGLMGSSLAWAVRRRGLAGHVVAYARREESRRDALAAGMVDSVESDPSAAVEGADLIVLCTPVLSMEPLLRSCAEGLSEGAIVTDVGSTKAYLSERLSPVVEASGAVFVGSHPMCGSEKTGLSAAREDLYDGALVIVTAGSNVGPGAVQAVTTLWEGVGSRTMRLSPSEHDQLVGGTSHLPHMAAAAVVRAVTDSFPNAGALCGNGFRDVTRVAEGSPDVWRDIVETNADVLVELMGRLETSVTELRDLMLAGDYDGVQRFLAIAAEARRKYLKDSNEGT